jgi:hypothetical protein
MDLEHLINKVTRLLNEESGIILHSDQTQSLIRSNHTILWNPEPANISEEIYNKFREVLKKSTSKYYNMTNILPYVDFCIALLCSSGYSLNHTVTKSMHSRIFTGAWRSIHVQSRSSSGDLAEWLQLHIHGRTAKGYANTFKLDMDAGTIPIHTSGLGRSNRRYEVKDIIEDATLSGEVVDIKHYGDDNLPTPKIFYSTNMPEGQLADLRVAHEILTKGWY